MCSLEFHLIRKSMLAAQGSKSSAHIQVQCLQVLQYADAMCRLFCAAITATRQHVRPVRYGVQARRMEGSSSRVDTSSQGSQGLKWPLCFERRK